MLTRQSGVRFALGLLIIFNIFYFVHLAYYSYVWHDESLVLLHLSGYTPEQLINYLFDGQIKSTEQLWQFQGVNSVKGFPDTLASLYTSSNYDLPLYYSFLWFLARLSGNSYLVLRGFSVIIWLGILWSFYHLALTLFKNKNAALIATTLIFFSPRFTGYALGIWEYGLYVFCSILSSWLFLKAIDSSQPKKDWFFYSLSLIAGLYTHVFFIFVLVVHSLYFLLQLNSFNSLTKKYYSISLLASLWIYSIWLTRIFTGRFTIFGWSKGSLPLEVLWQRWVIMIARLFYNFSLANPTINPIIEYCLIILVIISFIYLGKKADKKVFTLIILLTIIPFFSLLAWDLIRGFRYTAVGRFYLPSFLGMLLAVTFLLSNGLQQRQGWAKILLILLLVFGLIAKIPYPPPATRYVGYGSNIPNAYTMINRSQKPLIISEHWLDTLPLIHTTDAKTKYLFVQSNPKVSIPSLKNQFTDIYLLNPSPSLRQYLDDWSIQLSPTENQAFWRID